MSLYIKKQAAGYFAIALLVVFVDRCNEDRD